MGLIGWLSRRVLAWVLFPPLAAMWYFILLYLTRANPIPIERLAVAALLFAAVTDWTIVHRVKKMMKRKQPKPPRQGGAY